MYPTTCEYMRYIGHRERERTEEDMQRIRKNREEFERCFLPPGSKLIPLSEMKE